MKDSLHSCANRMQATRASSKKLWTALGRAILNLECYPEFENMELGNNSV